MPLTAGDIYTVHDQNKIRRDNQGFQYFRLKYWDGRNWIVRFIKSNDTDWIALPEGRILDMIVSKVVARSTPTEQLDALIMESKHDPSNMKIRKSSRDR